MSALQEFFWIGDDSYNFIPFSTILRRFKWVSQSVLLTERLLCKDGCRQRPSHTCGEGGLGAHICTCTCTYMHMHIPTCTCGHKAAPHRHAHVAWKMEVGQGIGRNGFRYFSLFQNWASLKVENNTEQCHTEEGICLHYLFEWITLDPTVDSPVSGGNNRHGKSSPSRRCSREATCILLQDTWEGKKASPCPSR